MTDRQFEGLLQRLHKAHVKYHKLLIQAEEEYKCRYGEYPSDVDDDYWIDTFHQSPVSTTLEDVRKNALIRK